MTRDDSTILKGIAILLMLFLHLFSPIDNALLCYNQVMIGEYPLSYILTRVAGPVPFYIILSGYGMYLVQRRGAYDVVSKMKRLYLHYWISLALFIPLGAMLIGAHKYPGSFSDIISNVTGYHTTWNATIWFLLPYVLLAMTSKYIWRILDNTNTKIFVTIALGMNLIASFLISRYGAAFLYANSWCYIPVLYFQMLFPFSLGGYLYKYSIVSMIQKRMGGGKEMYCGL